MRRGGLLVEVEVVVVVVVVVVVGLDSRMWISRSLTAMMREVIPDGRPGSD